MKKNIYLSLLLSAMLLTAGNNFGQVSSTFDSDADGWTFSSAVNHNVSGGNPSGYVSSTYSANAGSTTQYWIAPAKFEGNHALKSLGMNLTFDMQQSTGGTATLNSGDVRILSGSLTLVYALPTKPATAPAWSSYSIKLDETAGWRVASLTGPPATRSEVIAALSGITSLEIRASYATANPYTSGLDNVVMEERTLSVAPTIDYFSPEAATAGTTVVISGSDFAPDFNDNRVFFGATEAIVTSAGTNELHVTVPDGATFEPITVINLTTGLSCKSRTQFNPLFADGGRIIPATFGTPEQIVLTGTTEAVALADMDGDGNTDILATAGNNVAIHRNLGNSSTITSSSFASGVLLPGAGNVPKLFVEDIDGDGKRDIAAGYTSGSLNYFGTFRNTSTPGNLSFEPVEYWAGLVYSGRMSSVSDVDGDGRADLIGQHGNSSGSADFWIAQNISSPGEIEFAASQSFFGGFTVDAGGGTTMADLDNDGKPEAIISYNFNGNIAIAKNTSTPSSISFGTPMPLGDGIRGSLQVADFNKDGKMDLAWKKGGSNDDLMIRINSDTDGVLDAADFSTAVTINTDFGTYGAVYLGDINGDGKPDVTACDGSYIGVFENVYSGNTFSSSSFVPAYLRPAAGLSTYPTEVVAGDLNGDNKPDLVTAITNLDPGRIYIYENKNIHTPEISINTVSPLRGTVGSTVTITGDSFSTVPNENVVRFGSLKATVVSATRNELRVLVPAGASLSDVSVTRNQLTSTYHLPFQVTFSPGVTSFDNTHFLPPISYTLTGADYDVEAADFNNDNKPDVGAEGTAGRSYIFANTHSSGAIAVSSLVADDTTSTTAQNLKTTDIDGDGLADITSASGIYTNGSSGSEISFNTNVPLATTLATAFADFNKDGKTDVVGVNGSNVGISENRTTSGALSTAFPVESMSGLFNYTKSASGGGCATGDFDNNGLPDFAATNPGSDNVTIYLNNGAYRISTTQFTAQTAITVGDNPGRIYSGDLDSDGLMDLMLYYSTGTTSQFVTVLHNKSTPGSIQFDRHDFTIGGAGTTAALSDLDGDGKAEIIVAMEALNRFSILKNNSSPGTMDAASFAAPFNTSVTAPRGVTTADLNLDGKPEIILTRAAGFLLVYENVVPSPSITIDVQPQPITPCYGSVASLTIMASGTTNLTYQWQKFNIEKVSWDNLTNNATISGVQTPTLTIGYVAPIFGGQYRCIVSGDFATAVTSATATLTIPPQLGLPSGTDVTICPGTTATLTATGGTDGNYRWFTQPAGGSPIGGAVNGTYQTPVLTQETDFYVAFSDGICEGERRRITVRMDVSCNQPPVIATTTVETTPGSEVIINLASLISDPDNNIDLSSIEVISTTSGAPASVDGSGVLTIDYSGSSFSGTDVIVISACDLQGQCATQSLQIFIAGELLVYNGISPNGDGKNDLWYIRNIEVLPDTRTNTVKIFNRWGDLVWEGENYDNAVVVFAGKSENGKDLPTGTYFYDINFHGNRATITGFLSLKR
jgi:gliding motility-associated-like protein